MHKLYFDQGNSKKGCMGINTKVEKVKRYGTEDHNKVTTIKHR